MGDVKIQTVSDAGEIVDVIDELEELMNAIESRAYLRVDGSKAGETGGEWPESGSLLLGAPAAQVRQHAGRLELRIALEGFDADQVALIAAPGDMVLRAETAMPRRDHGQMRVKAMRRFALPRTVNLAGATANLESGILTILAPMAA